MDLEADTIIKAATETCTQISALKNEYCCGDLDISHGVSFLEVHLWLLCACIDKICVFAIPVPHALSGN